MSLGVREVVSIHVNRRRLQRCGIEQSSKQASQGRGRPSNNAVNATVLVSRRLQSKRRASRPARYRGR